MASKAAAFLAADAGSLTTARVVIGSPIVAPTPLFSLVILLIFLRGKESVTSRTILGTVADDDRHAFGK
jgi:hypothetical protein